MQQHAVIRSHLRKLLILVTAGVTKDKHVSIRCFTYLLSMLMFLVLISPKALNKFIKKTQIYHQAITNKIVFWTFSKDPLILVRSVF